MTYNVFGGTLNLAQPFHQPIIPISAVKEFWKLAKISESYWQKFGGFLFWNTVYYYNHFMAPDLCLGLPR